MEYWFIESHHSLDIASPQEPTGDYLDLCEPIVRGGRKFFPLVRDSFALKSSLRISFLRKEEPGKVYQAGDLDNRLKTLFDALAVPKDEQVVSDQTIVDPIYCLLEDDALIANCTIETHRLLSRPLASKYVVILLIEVDVRVIQPRQYNQSFLGD